MRKGTWMGLNFVSAEGNFANEIASLTQLKVMKEMKQVCIESMNDNRHSPFDLPYSVKLEVTKVNGICKSSTI